MANFWAVPIYTEREVLALAGAVLEDAPEATGPVPPGTVVIYSHAEIPVTPRFLNQAKVDRVNGLLNILQSMRLGRPGFSTVPKVEN